jgi:hypothetical protein
MVRRFSIMTPLVILAFWQSIQDGNAQKFPRQVGDGAVLFRVVFSDKTDITALRVAPEKLDIRVLAAVVPIPDSPSRQLSNPERRARGYSLEEYLRRYSALAVMSGGYIDTYSPPTPLGLVKSNGILVQKPHRSWLVEGLFCSDIDRAQILLIENLEDQGRFRDCVQAGPVLLKGGIEPDLPSRRNDSYLKLASRQDEQVFVCINNKDEVLIGISSKMELRRLPQALLQPALHCVDAIRMTSAVSGGLQVGDTLFGKDDFLFPSAIAIMRRAK